MDERRRQLIPRMQELAPWHHDIDLGDGIKTPTYSTGAYDPRRRWRVIENCLPSDLEGKSVLDLGCNSGFLSVQFKQRGAERVVAVEAFPRAVQQTAVLAEWFDVDLEIVHEDAHSFCLTCDERFDYIVFLGAFYHLKYGTLVLDRLAEMTRSLLFFQTVHLDALENDPGPIENLSYSDRRSLLESPAVPRLTFVERKFETDLTNWWLANHAAIYALLRSAGLELVEEGEEDMFVCRPNNPLGKVVYDKCVFPRYGKAGGVTLPRTSRG